MSVTKNRLARLEAMAVSLPVKLLCNCDRSGETWENTTVEEVAMEWALNRHGKCGKPMIPADRHAKFMRDVRMIYGDD